MSPSLQKMRTGVGLVYCSICLCSNHCAILPPGVVSYTSCLLMLTCGLDFYMDAKAILSPWTASWQCCKTWLATLCVNLERNSLKEEMIPSDPVDQFITPLQHGIQKAEGIIFLI